MNRTADDETKAADKMAEKVSQQKQIYVRKRCRKCSHIAGSFTTSDLSKRSICIVKLNGFTECGGDMVEIWRGRL